MEGEDTAIDFSKTMRVRRSKPQIPHPPNRKVIPVSDLPKDNSDGPEHESIPVHRSVENRNKSVDSKSTKRKRANIRKSSVNLIKNTSSIEPNANTTDATDEKPISLSSRRSRNKKIVKSSSVLKVQAKEEEAHHSNSDEVPPPKKGKPPLPTKQNNNPQINPAVLKLFGNSNNFSQTLPSGNRNNISQVGSLPDRKMKPSLEIEVPNVARSFKRTANSPTTTRAHANSPFKTNKKNESSVNLFEIMSAKAPKSSPFAGDGAFKGRIRKKNNISTADFDDISASSGDKFISAPQQHLKVRPPTSKQAKIDDLDKNYDLIAQKTKEITDSDKIFEEKYYKFVNMPSSRKAAPLSKRKSGKISRFMSLPITTASFKFDVNEDELTRISLNDFYDSDSSFKKRIDESKPFLFQQRSDSLILFHINSDLNIEDTKTKNSDLKWYQSSVDYISLPTSFIPYYPTHKLKFHQRVELSLDAVDTELGINSQTPINRPHDSYYFELDDTTANIPLSNLYSNDPEDNPFFASTLFPLNLEINNFKEEIMKTKIEMRQHFILQYCVRYITPEMQPVSTAHIIDVPIYADYFIIKNKNGDLTEEYFAITAKQDLMTNDQCFSLKGTVANVIDKNNFEIISNGEKTQFKTPNAETCAKTLNEVVQYESSAMFDFYISSLGVKKHYQTYPQLIVSALTSSYLIYPIVLLNDATFSLDQCKNVFKIFVHEKKIDYLLRSLILSELTFALPDEIFNVETVFSDAILHLFTAVSQKWLQRLTMNLVKNEVVTYEAFLKLLYAAFSSIPKKSFYIFRVLVLYCIVVVKENPLAIVFRFLARALRPYFKALFPDKLTYLDTPIDFLQSALASQNQKSRQFLELAPFIQKIISSEPELKISSIDDCVESIYKCSHLHLRNILSEFERFHDLHPTRHPLISSFFQTIKFQLREIEL